MTDRYHTRECCDRDVEAWARQLAPDWRERFEKRAAIMEIDGRLVRAEAERAARRQVESQIASKQENVMSNKRIIWATVIVGIIAAGTGSIMACMERSRLRSVDYGAGVYESVKYEPALDMFSKGKTYIYWERGSVTVLRGTHSVPMARGQKYRVWRDTDNRLRFDMVEE